MSCYEPVPSQVRRQIGGIMWLIWRRHPNPEPLSRPLAGEWEINRPSHVATHMCIKWPHHSNCSSYVGCAQAKVLKVRVIVSTTFQAQFGPCGCFCALRCGKKAKHQKILWLLRVECILWKHVWQTNPGVLGCQCICHQRTEIRPAHMLNTLPTTAAKIYHILITGLSGRNTET